MAKRARTLARRVANLTPTPIKLRDRLMDALLHSPYAEPRKVAQAALAIWEAERRVAGAPEAALAKIAVVIPRLPSPAVNDSGQVYAAVLRDFEDVIAPERRRRRAPERQR